MTYNLQQTRCLAKCKPSHLILEADSALYLFLQSCVYCGIMPRTGGIRANGFLTESPLISKLNILVSGTELLMHVFLQSHGHIVYI
jgi:hypothetical protein